MKYLAYPLILLGIAVLVYLPVNLQDNIVGMLPFTLVGAVLVILGFEFFSRTLKSEIVNEVKNKG